MAPAIEPWRRLALGVLLLGLIGTATELLLLGHYESRFQLPPLVMLTAGMVAAGLVAIRPTTALVKLLRAIMALYVPVAGAGSCWLRTPGCRRACVTLRRRARSPPGRSRR